jgi:hypothetical protein
MLKIPDLSFPHALDAGAQLTHCTLRISRSVSDAFYSADDYVRATRAKAGPAYLSHVVAQLVDEMKSREIRPLVDVPPDRAAKLVFLTPEARSKLYGYADAVGAVPDVVMEQIFSIFVANQLKR